jgi:hypothetical protein
MRRGRKKDLHVGDALDFWRIEQVDYPAALRLRAEMRLPGEAWLTWNLEVTSNGTVVHQSATFRPRGLFGRLYWALVWPFHGFIFPNMLKGILSAAEKKAFEA